MKAEALPFLFSGIKIVFLSPCSAAAQTGLPTPRQSEPRCQHSITVWKTSSFGKDRIGRFFHNVWECLACRNPCWLPAGLPGSQCTELQILLIPSKCVNFAAALSVFHHPCPKQEIHRRGLFLFPLKPAAGFPSTAKRQDLYLTK